MNYSAWKCPLKPWIINKLGNFQLVNCYRDVTEPVLAQVVSPVRVLSGGETGGTALIHDNEMRVTCNFTNSAIEEFEKKELETSECEFGDLRGSIIVLERYRIVPTLSSGLKDCVFTILVYSFTLKSFTRTSRGYQHTRMANQHYRIANKLKELWGQWKKGDLTIVSDESDSGGTITDSTLRHTVQFMEELERAEQLKEKSCGEDLGSSNCQEELHHRDKEQPRVVAEDSNNANNQCQEDYSEQDERRGTDQNSDRRMLVSKNPLSDEELTTATFKIKMSKYTDNKCSKHEGCILLTSSLDNEEKEEEECSVDSLTEVLDALPILLYTSVPGHVSQDLPRGLNCWEAEALDAAINDEDNSAQGRCLPVTSSDSLTVTTPCESSPPQECQEGLVALHWPPSGSSSVDPVLSGNGTQSAADPEIGIRVDRRDDSQMPEVVQLTNSEEIYIRGRPLKMVSASQELKPDIEGNNLAGMKGNLPSASANKLMVTRSIANDNDGITGVLMLEEAEVGSGDARVDSDLVIPESCDPNQDQVDVSGSQSTSQRSGFNRREPPRVALADIVQVEDARESTLVSSVNNGEAVARGRDMKSLGNLDIPRTESHGEVNIDNGKSENEGKAEVITWERCTPSESISAKASVKEGPHKENVEMVKDALASDGVDIDVVTSGINASFYPETQALHLDDTVLPPGYQEGVNPSLSMEDEEWPYETQPFEVEDPALPLGHQEEVNPYLSKEDEERPCETQPFEVEDPALPRYMGKANLSPGMEETQPFDVADSITKRKPKDSAQVIDSGDGCMTSTEQTNSPFPDVPSSLLNNAFLQTQTSQEKQLILQKATGSQNIKERFLPDPPSEVEDDLLPSRIPGPESQINTSETSDSLEDTIIKVPSSDSSEELQTCVTLDTQSQGISTRSQLLGPEEISNLVKNKEVGTRNVQTKCLNQAQHAENEVLSGLEVSDEDKTNNQLFHRQTCQPRSSANDLKPHESSPEELASIPSTEQRSDPAKRICAEFVKKLDDLRCSCSESISDESQPSQCSSCQSQIGGHTLEQPTRAEGKSAVKNIKSTTNISCIGTSSPNEILRLFTSRSSTVTSGGDNHVRERMQALPKPLLEVEARTKKRKYRRMNVEEAAMPKWKLTEKRFLEWLSEKGNADFFS
ncbi:uncharacterized protein [Apostichopus japonicus]|uniref:uncharacterized protein isoform X2 n=1 Tax=Stichopus japonicus TaxID=307972 RepID=UPI003AB78E56